MSYIIRLQFKELLESIFSSSKDCPTQKVETMQHFLIKNTPKKLYRYRTFNENSLTALLNDEIWASKPDTFNDPYDSYPGVNLRDIHVALNHYLEEQTIQKFLPDDKLADYVLSAYNDIVKKGNNNYIACFSENIKSMLMWSHYADNHKGFVLEYDFQEINGKCEVDCPNRSQCDRFEMKYPLFPIIYQAQRYDAKEHMLWFTLDIMRKENNIQIDTYVPDNYISIKPFLYKQTVWEYEQEWRLLIESSSTNNYTSKKGVKAKAIYINDEKISKTNKDIITKIANDKNITLKNMKLNLFDLDYVMNEK